MRSGRRLQRPLGERRYKKLFVIAVEGEKTEPLYFSIFNDDSRVVHVRCLEGKTESAPPHVLQRMVRYLADKEADLKKTDEAWLVVDKDQWSEQQLLPLHQWVSKRKRNGPERGFAVSNPSFEYWLLLHFEDGNDIADLRQCIHRLRHHLPESGKSIDPQGFSEEMILKAVERARKRNNPPCTDWPRNPGCTTVYLLVEKILEAGKKNGGRE